MCANAVNSLGRRGGNPLEPHHTEPLFHAMRAGLLHDRPWSRSDGLEGSPAGERARDGAETHGLCVEMSHVHIEWR